MRTKWLRIVSLAVILGSLVIVPTLGQSLALYKGIPIDMTFFPATGDTLTLVRPPFWRAHEDRAEGWRTFEDIPELHRVSYALVIGNGLMNNGTLNIIFRVNNERVGTMYAVEGAATTIVRGDFEFEPIAGPDYKFLIELENGVDAIQGGITVPLDTSPLIAFGFSFCPVATALDGAGDAEGLALMRRFRNEMLGTNQVLLEHVDAYYLHAEEANTILTHHPLLLARTARLLRRSLPAVKALLDGDGQDMIVPASDLRAAYRLLDDLARRASPEFAATLHDLRGMLEQFDGVTVAHGWQQVSSP